MDYGQGGNNSCGSCCSHELGHQVSAPGMTAEDPMAFMLQLLGRQSEEVITQMSMLRPSHLQPVAQSQPAGFMSNESHTATWGDTDFVMMLSHLGYDTDGLLRVFQDGGHALAALKATLDADRWNELSNAITWVPKASKPVTETSLIEKGQIQMQGPQGKAGHSAPVVPEQIRVLGADSTLADLVATHLVPDLTKQLADTASIEDDVKRLREQRRITDRLQKLMRYTNKPESIRATAIACKHELAIYKWYLFNQAARGSIGMQTLESRIDAAHKAFQRQEDIAQSRANDLLAEQTKNTQRALVMEKMLEEVGVIDGLINGLETRQLAKKFREMADELDRVEDGGTVPQQVQLDFVPGTTSAEAFPLALASDNSDMGLDYRRSVPTTEGGFSDDKFGAPTRRGLSVTLPHSGLQVNLKTPTPEQVDAINASGRVRRLVTGLDLGNNPGIQSSEYPPRGGRLVLPVATNQEQKAQDFVESIISRLQNGEAVKEEELLKAASFLPGLDDVWRRMLAEVIGTRMFGKTPFLQ